MIYLDNAATTFPKPKAVRTAMNNAMMSLCANPGRSGHKMSQDTAMAVYSTRAKAAEFFGESTVENVIFTLNCTHAVNYVLKGLIKPGDHVVTSSLEHNAVMRPLVKLRQSGVTFDVAEVMIGDPDATFRSFERTIKPGTKLVICTNASNVIGAALPIERIGKLCRERGILFAVDAAQTAGVLPIDVDKMCIDYLCVAAHKGLYGPMGTGILIAHSGSPDTIIEGGTGTASVSMQQPDDLPERMESGTVNAPGIIALGAGIDFVSGKGVDRIYKHEMALIRQAYDGLLRIDGIKMYTARPNESFVPVLSFNIGETSSTEAAAALDSAGIAVRAGLHCAPTAHKRIGTIEQGTVRICPSAFTTADDIDRFLFAVRRIAGRSKSLFY